METVPTGMVPHIQTGGNSGPVVEGRTRVKRRGGYHEHAVAGERLLLGLPTWLDIPRGSNRARPEKDPR